MHSYSPGNVGGDDSCNIGSAFLRIGKHPLRELGSTMVCSDFNKMNSS